MGSSLLRDISPVTLSRFLPATIVLQIEATAIQLVSGMQPRHSCFHTQFVSSATQESFLLPDYSPRPLHTLYFSSIFLLHLPYIVPYLVLRVLVQALARIRTTHFVIPSPCLTSDVLRQLAPVLAIETLTETILDCFPCLVRRMG